MVKDKHHWYLQKVSVSSIPMDCKHIQTSSSSRRAWKYEVFLSFRGEDTRNNFTDHLFAALKRKGVFVFKDDKELKKGEAISLELLKAIEESRISIVIFSRTYAKSTWCLDELAKIAECLEVFGQTVTPIFYDVNPSEVRKQSGSCGKFFIEHEERFNQNLDKVQRWRLAMSKVGRLAGWDLQNKPESREIEKIVREVINRLGHKFSSLADELVGIQSRAKALETLLNKESNDDVQFVGICGMPGIGKTTLAAVVYDRISHQFDACSFLANVSKVFKDDGLVHLQEQLLSETLKLKNLKIWNCYEGINLISSKLSHLKTLIVLDNIDDSEQIENLVGKVDWFGPGSKIIITTRDEHILKRYAEDGIYKVELMTDDEVRCLICRKAFKSDDPMDDYKELTCRVVEYVKGLPLAAKVLGSHLFGRDVLEWKSTLARLQANPKNEIINVLRTSFDGLDEVDKEIFLDIGCFFHGMYINDVKRILDYCGFNPNIGIRVHIDKSLITTDKIGRIWMHDLLQALGWKIVRENAPKEPGKWSRLWDYNNFKDAMMESTITKDVEAIVMNLKEAQNNSLRADGLSNFSRLRLLIFRNVEFSGSLRCLSNNLKFIQWHDYPFTYLPSNFQPEKLCELTIPNSCIKQLWEGIKPLVNLKRMDLRYSKNLSKSPNFNLFPNLELLNLEGCARLWRVDESIGILAKLRYLNLNDCKNLARTPRCMYSLNSLETLCLSGCLKLKNQLEKLWQEEELERGETGKQSILSIVQKSFAFPFHFFFGRHNGIVHPSLAFSSTVKELDLSYCNLCEIPNSVGWIHCLEKLNLSGNDFITLPSTIKNLSKLNFLDLTLCKNLQSLPELPSSVGRNGDHLSGLSMFNCSKLAGLEGCSRLALSWQLKCFQVVAHKRLSIVVPVSKIPRWFHHQSLGPSIRIQVPRHVTWVKYGYRDNNWLGLACCATFAANDLYVAPNDGVKVLSLMWHFDDTCIYMANNLKLEKKPATANLDHLWLIFIPWKDPLLSQWLPQQRSKGYFIDLSITIDANIQVKTCGAHWVFKKGVERLEHNLKRGESSNMQIHDHSNNDHLGIIADSFLSSQFQVEN